MKGYQERNLRLCSEKIKGGYFIFSSLITGVCEAFRVKFEAKDEWVKNKGAITARTIDKIDVELATATTLEHPTIATSDQPATSKV